MAHEFKVISGPDKGQSFGLPSSGSTLFGRSDAVQCKLGDEDVAMAHFEISADGNSLWLRDCGTPGGTLVNGKKSREVELAVGDVITAANTQLKLQKVGEGSTGEMTTGVTAIMKLEDTEFGQYKLGKRFAEGRSSVVYKAKDAKSKATVALKILRSEYANTDERINRFIRAMKAVLKLEHPNLITVYGAGKTSGLCWVAMEFVDGESLSQVIERIGIAGQLEWTYAYKVAVQIARALVYAYKNQIIHRNITPTNILMAKDGVAKLGDLMLAKGLEGEAAIEVTQMDGPGQMIGEDVMYMPPERMRGEALDVRSDIYGLGATVYALLTGRPPLQGKNPLKAILAGAQVESPKKYQLAIPDLFEGTVMTMLAQNPEDRFETPAQLLDELEKVGKYSNITVD